MTSADRPVGLRRRTLLKTGILGCVAGTVPVGSVSAQDTEIAECTTIDAAGDYRLTDDLSGDGTCLTIAASDVSLDGDGHVIAGNGNDAGIRIDGSDIEVRGLELTGFETGLLLPDPGSEEIEIADCTVRGNATGINAQLGSDLSIVDTTITENEGAGLWYHMWEGVDVVDTTIRDNGGPAIDNQEGWSLTLEGSALVDNAAGVRAAPGGRITENEIRGNENHGVSVDPFPQPPFPDPVIIEDNEIVENGETGIEIFLGRAEIRRNTIAANRNGIVLEQEYDEGEEWVPTAAVEGNAIVDHDEDGLRNDTGQSITATCNWWGDDRGPIHPDNPLDDPTGAIVQGPVDIVPWRMTEDDRCVGGTAAFAVELGELPRRVTVGESFEIPFAVENVGNLEGTQSVQLLVGNERTDDREISLAGEAADSDAFTYEATEDDMPVVEIAVRTEYSEDRETVSVISDEVDDVDDDDDVADEPPDDVDDDDDVEPPDDDDPNNEDQIPGFGLFAAIAGIAGAGYVLLRRRSKD